MVDTAAAAADMEADMDMVQLQQLIWLFQKEDWVVVTDTHQLHNNTMSMWLMKRVTADMAVVLHTLSR